MNTEYLLWQIIINSCYFSKHLLQFATELLIIPWIFDHHYISLVTIINSSYDRNIKSIIIQMDSEWIEILPYSKQLHVGLLGNFPVNRDIIHPYLVTIHAISLYKSYHNHTELLLLPLTFDYEYRALIMPTIHTPHSLWWS